ncbi:MAG: RNA polymerase sigma factor [Phycisphaerae bacterium]|nr:RNA polymerase sigma factor [Phycisphaerae bacterium]
MVHDRDEWLMSEVAGGRAEALEPLIRRYAHPLLTFIRRMIGDYHRSEEVFQDVFVMVWKKRTSYQTFRPFKPWIFAIALNRCRSELRRQRTPMLPMLDNDLNGAADMEPAGGVAITTEQATMVMAAVLQLPVKQRAVVVLRTWSGLSYAEIADVLNRSQGTVRAQMHQALAGLRESLEPRMR